MLTTLTPLDWKRRAIKYYPEKTAVVDGEKRFTYKEFGDRVDQLSSALYNAGIRQGDHVAVMIPNTHYMLESFYGICQLGAVMVPLNYRLSSQDLRYIVDHSDAKMLIIDEEFTEAIEEIEAELDKVKQYIIVSVDGQSTSLKGTDYEAFLNEPSENAVIYPELPIGENDLLTVNYTSGTTSKPKGVMLTHRGNYLNAANFLYHLKVTHEDIYLHTLPMFHANGWGGIWALTAAGGTHVCLRKVDPAHILTLFERERISVLCGAPTVVNMLINEPKSAHVNLTKELRMATAGSPPAATLIQKAQDILGLNIMHVYGLTETSPFILYCEWHKEFDSKTANEQATIKARQGIELVFNGETKVIREDGNEADWDGEEIGEIITRGNVVMSGYYKDPERTEEVMRDGWFHTEDLAVTHPDGYIEIRDRAKDMIISGGENISSTELEGLLYTHPDILEVAIIAIPHDKWGEVPKAVVVLKEGGKATEDDIIKFCQASVARFKAPKSVEFVDELPKTATGKLQKYQLRNEHWDKDKKVN